MIFIIFRISHTQKDRFKINGLSSDLSYHMLIKSTIRVSSEKEKSFRENFAKSLISRPFCLLFAFRSLAKKCKNFRFFREISLPSVSRKNGKFSRNRKCENFAKQKMQNFREKNNAKISRKNGNYAKNRFFDNKSKW